MNLLAFQTTENDGKNFSYALRCSWLFRSHWPGMEAHLGSKCHAAYVKENPFYVTESPLLQLLMHNIPCIVQVII